VPHQEQGGNLTIASYHTGGLTLVEQSSLPALNKPKVSLTKKLWQALTNRIRSILS
jgi:hypothetical protein